MNRRLAAVLLADVVGYSRLMEADEAGTLAALKQRRRDVLQPILRQHGGRVVKFMGDGVLIEFASAVAAVTAALALQREMEAHFASLDRPLRAVAVRQFEDDGFSFALAVLKPVATRDDGLAPCVPHGVSSRGAPLQ